MPRRAAVTRPPGRVWIETDLSIIGDTDDVSPAPPGGCGLKHQQYPDHRPWRGVTRPPRAGVD